MNTTKTYRPQMQVRVQHVETPPCRAIVRPMLMALCFAAAIASCDGVGDAWAKAPAAAVGTTAH